MSVSLNGLTSIPNTAVGGQRPLERFDILDALRFVLALWVTVAHVGVFPVFAPLDSSGILHIISRAFNSTVWGMPAVMAFFVISGFCIHYPVQAGRPFHAGSFYLRRYTRILIPASLVIYALTQLNPQTKLFGYHSIIFGGTLWSLLCEEIYYAIYPWLRRVQDRISWGLTFLGASIISVAVATYAGYAGPARDWFDVGPIGTAVILLPIWILGCILAEEVRHIRHTVSTWRIWLARGGAWATMLCAEMLNFHTPISQVHTMLFVGFIAYLWLREEIAHARHHRPNRVFVLAGAWSYSLYLVHPLVIDFAQRYLKNMDASTQIGWLLTMATALVASFVFYLMVERPSHFLARKISKPRANASSHEIVAT